MKTKLLSAFLFVSLCTTAQNLVPNGDFEQHTGCPNAANQLDSAMYWMNTSPDVQNSGTPDYFNACDTFMVDVPSNPYYGYQVAHSGDAYAGILLYTQLFGGNIREYIEAPLTQTLTPGFLYHFEMYINVPNNFMWSSDDIGVYFSDTAVTNIMDWAPLTQFVAQIQNPQGNLPDTSNWMLVSGNYLGTGGESYLIIGNFKNDLQTSATQVNAGGNPYAYVYIDDVSLSHITGVEEETENHSISTYPNPASDQLNVTANVTGNLQFELFDHIGKLQKTQTFSGTTIISLADLAPGIYFYEVLGENGLLDKGTVIRQ